MFQYTNNIFKSWRKTKMTREELYKWLETCPNARILEEGYDFIQVVFEVTDLAHISEAEVKK